MSISFLHTADWQLGKRFDFIGGDPAALLREQRLGTVRAIAEHAARRGVDAVLVAGDVFEFNEVSDQTLRRTAQALEVYAGDWVLLPGNHDAAVAESAWTRWQRLGVLGQNVRLALEPAPLVVAGGRMEVLPAPLTRRHEANDVTAWFDAQRTPESRFRVGLAHGSVAELLPPGVKVHNPIALGRSLSAQLDYLALGDWHGTLKVNDRTWYAGTHEPERFRANAPGNVLEVRIAAPGSTPDVEVVPVAHYEWREDTLDLTGSPDDHPHHRIQSLIDAFEQPLRGLLRLRITGATDLASRATLQDALEAARARLHVLDEDLGALDVLPSEDDLAQFAGTGFVRDAVEALRAQLTTASASEQQAIRRALVIAFLEYRRLDGNA